MHHRGYTLLRAVGVLAGVISTFVAGVLTERHRPFGGEYMRRNAMRLAAEMARYEVDYS